MRTTALIAAAVFLSVSSAQFGGVPSCAKPCVALYTSGANVANCNSLDIHCICSNADFLNGIACCLTEKCDASGQKDAIAYAKSICSTANPPVVVPDEVVCSSTSSGGTAAPTTSSSGATQAGSETTAATTGQTTGGATTPLPTTAAESSSTSAAASSSSSGAAMMNMGGGSGIGLAGGLAAVLMLL